MNGRKNKTPWIACMIVCFPLWGVLCCLKVAGAMTTPVFFWLSVFTFLPLIMYAMLSLAAVVARLLIKLKRWYRRRKTDRRIIAQAKAAGVWDKQPIVLGGRALELRAWKDFKMKREPGEPDHHLRVRYTMEKLREYQKEKERREQEDTRK